jgi:homoserine dehydrogenase
MPYFVPGDNALGTINNEYNGIEVEGVYSDKQFFAGKGAGGHSTGSAVLSDISAITYDYKYGYRKLKKRSNGHAPDYSKDNEFVDEDFLIRLYIRYHNKNELKGLQIETVEEEYSSADSKYIIAQVNFASLRTVKSDSNLFICALE